MPSEAGHYEEGTMKRALRGGHYEEGTKRRALRRVRALWNSIVLYLTNQMTEIYSSVLRENGLLNETKFSYPNATSLA